jgi:NADPH2:quinone reductase
MQKRLRGTSNAPVKELTCGRGADVIFDSVGGDVFERSTRCVAFEGQRQLF